MTDNLINKQALHRHMKDAVKVTFRMSGKMRKDLKSKAERKCQPMATIMRTAVFEYLYGHKVKE